MGASVKLVGPSLSEGVASASVPSSSRIDLVELARRESEQVEWKENVADIDNVVATLAAFANDFSNLGGGYVVCGAREVRDEHGFPSLSVLGLDAKRLREVEGKVLARCRDRVHPPLTPLVDVMPTGDPSRRVLVFTMVGTGDAHSVRSATNEPHSGVYYVRRSSSTQRARNGLLRQLLTKANARPPWDRRVQDKATVDDLDLVALRALLTKVSRWDERVPLQTYLQERKIAERVPPLCESVWPSKEIRPRNFALLLVGTKPHRFCPGAYVVVSTYPGVDKITDYSERREILGSLLEQWRELDTLLARLGRDRHEVGSDRVHNFVDYPYLALREVVVNALAHRDYEEDGPIRITVFSDRVEVYSPGALDYRVEPTQFLRGDAGPNWRNQAFSWLFRELDLAQEQGQGVSRVFKLMAEAGCPPPQFELGAASVTCRLFANPRGQRTALMLAIDGPLGLPSHPAFGAEFRVPAVAEDPLLQRRRLRSVPVDRDAWEGLVAQLDQTVRRAAATHGEALHVFAIGPHAAAALMGRMLDDHARSRALHLYQLSHDSKGWELVSPVERSDEPPYFGELVEGGRFGEAAVVLAIDGLRSVDPARRDRLAQKLGGCGYHLPARREAPLRPGQFAEASEVMRAAVHRCGELHPGAALHVVTTAPVSLMVELGRLLSPTAVSGATFYLYRPDTADYEPVVDVVAGTICSADT